MGAHSTTLKGAHSRRRGAWDPPSRPCHSEHILGVSHLSSRATWVGCLGPGPLPRGPWFPALPLWHPLTLCSTRGADRWPEEPWAPVAEPRLWASGCSPPANTAFLLQNRVGAGMVPMCGSGVSCIVCAVRGLGKKFHLGPGARWGHPGGSRPM